MIFGSIFATFVAINDIGPEPPPAADAGRGGTRRDAVDPRRRSETRLGINEIISTLLLNYVAFNFLLYLLYGVEGSGSLPHSGSTRKSSAC
jgi:simple sugar transport system permease protein